MSKFLSSAQALTQLNECLSKPISNQQFRTLYKLMAAYGDATPAQHRQSGWVMAGELWKWRVYAVTRENLIAAGKWGKSRKYSIGDMEDIAIADMYEEYQPK